MLFLYSAITRMEWCKQLSVQQITRREKSMKRIIALLCLLFFLGGNAHGDQAAPCSADGPQIRQGQGGEFAPQGRPHSGPPQEAFKACEGKTEGSTAQFTGPDDETVTGICIIVDGRLLLRPDSTPRGNSRDGRRSPPPEAYKACEGKSVGSAAQFITPHGETIKGTCEQEDGKLVLRPNILKGERQR
jgi:hypothetical protein